MSHGSCMRFSLCISSLHFPPPLFPWQWKPCSSCGSIPVVGLLPDCVHLFRVSPWLVLTLFCHCLLQSLIMHLVISHRNYALWVLNIVLLHGFDPHLFLIMDYPYRTCLFWPLPVSNYGISHRVLTAPTDSLALHVTVRCNADNKAPFRIISTSLGIDLAGDLLSYLCYFRTYADMCLWCRVKQFQR